MWLQRGSLPFGLYRAMKEWVSSDGLDCGVRAYFWLRPETGQPALRRYLESLPRLDFTNDNSLGEQFNIILRDA